MRVGLTGGIGAGKSSVARLLAERGAVIIDSDVLAREVVEPGTGGLREIVEVFGPEVLSDDGSLDRAALARIVFATPEALVKLNAITHPRVGELATQREAEALALDSDAVIVHDIPLLYETAQAADFDHVIVVEVEPEVRIARLQASRGMSAGEARMRIDAQASDEARREIATILIDNNGDPGELERRVGEVWRELQ